MKHLTRGEFEARYPRRATGATIDGLITSELHIHEDATIAGMVEAPVYIHGDTHVVVTGVVEGPITVDREAVLWVEGLVDGRVHVDGAAFLSATCSARGARGAAVYDPCEPADSESGLTPN